MIRRGVNYLIYLKNFIGSITCETAGIWDELCFNVRLHFAVN